MERTQMFTPAPKLTGDALAVRRIADRFLNRERLSAFRDGLRHGMSARDAMALVPAIGPTTSLLPASEPGDRPFGKGVMIGDEWTPEAREKYKRESGHSKTQFPNTEHFAEAGKTGKYAIRNEKNGVGTGSHGPFGHKDNARAYAKAMGLNGKHIRSRTGGFTVEEPLKTGDSEAEQAAITNLHGLSRRIADRLARRKRVRDMEESSGGSSVYAVSPSTVSAANPAPAASVTAAKPDDVTVAPLGAEGSNPTGDAHEGFARLENGLAHEKGVRDPAGLAAAIGRKKLGNKAFNAKARAHRDAFTR
jgi:hypothetical protein